jgi:diguanylate cyclase (GGDEF)-like protein/PAS domain S-box-containing protein
VPRFPLPLSRVPETPKSRRPISQVRPLIIVGLIGLAVVCAAIIAVGGILIGSFRRIEFAEMQQRARQLKQALEADLRQLDVDDRDYAEWDDASAFLRTANPAFISANFISETLGTMRIDIVWIVDPHGQTLYSAYRDRETAKVISPAPAGYIETLHRVILGDRRPLPIAPWDLIARTPDGPLSVAAHEIRLTNRTGPTGAMMVFGRFIREAEVQRVRESTRLTMSMTNLGTATAPELPAPVRAWLQHGAGGDPGLVWAPNHDLINAYTVLRDEHGAPVAVLGTGAPRLTYALGYRTTLDLLAVILVLACISGGALIWFLLRLRKSLAARDAVELRYRIIGEQIHDAIVLVDPRTLQIIEGNGAACAALGCTLAQLPTHHIDELLAGIDPATVTELISTKGRHNALSQLRRGRIWLDAEITLTTADIDGRRLLVAIGHDISHRREAQERERDNRRKLLRAARHDALTGLPNRAHLNIRLPKVLSRVSATGQFLAVIYADLDHFKTINDCDGHPQGDLLLKTVAHRLRAALGPEDVVARVGGDEFVIVAPLLADERAVEELADRIRATVAVPIPLGNKTVSVTVSQGIAVFPKDGLDADTLLKRADIALHNAKNAGRHCHRSFCEEMASHVNREAELHQALHTALGTEQIYADYQPIVELKTGRVTSFEALARWNHPAHGLIRPDLFIPIAERSGLIVQLGEQMLRLVLAQLRGWLDAGIPLVPIAVNVSPLQIERTDFPEIVARLAAEAGVDMRWLRFELTEFALMNDRDRLVSSLWGLRKLGSQILIDDFGTGYSSLSYLDQLPVDVLKIDRTFVRDLGADVGRIPILNAIIQMAHHLRIGTVAEGVETAQQATLLLELGCDYGQGYLYSRPVSAIACRSLLQELRLDTPLTPTMLVRALSLAQAG